MFKFINSIVIFIIIIMCCYLYKKYEDKMLIKENDEYYLIRKHFLIEEDSITLSKKPMMFIHIDYEYNSRNWMSFGSRSSCELNIPFLYFTLKSIISHCDKSFNICIIDDSSFKKLIPYWDINIEKLPNPIKQYVRQLGIIKLLDKYGGINVPLSFLCFRDLIDMYDNNINNISNVFVCQTNDNNITNTYHKFYPSIDFMGCSKNNTYMKELIHFMELNISQDFTDQTKILGNFDRWLNDKIEKNIIKLVDGLYIGIKNNNGTSILLDDLMSDQYLNLNDEAYGILIPVKQLLLRRKYEYYCRLSKIQILEANCILSKHILIANVPETEAFDSIINNDVSGNEKSSRGIIGWWMTNLKPPMWGQKPLMVASKDNVIQLMHPAK